MRKPTQQQVSVLNLLDAWIAERKEVCKTNPFFQDGANALDAFRSQLFRSGIFVHTDPSKY